MQCYVYAQPTPGMVPLYRYWNSTGADHFYTTDFSELGNGKYSWVYELVQCYVYPQTPVPAGAVAVPPAVQTAATPATAFTTANAVPSSFAVTTAHLNFIPAPATFQIADR